MSSSNILQPLFAGRGLQITDIGLATGNQIQYQPIYEVGQTAAPGARRDVMGARYGVQLRFPGDLLPGPNGDLELTSGTEGVRDRFTRALITDPGEIFWRPQYGVGILSLLAFPVRMELLAEIERRVRASLQGDPDVASIEKVEASAPAQLNRVDVVVTFRLFGAEPLQRVGVSIAEAA